MANGASLASLVEDWIVARVAAVQTDDVAPLTVFTDGLVEAFRGTTSPTGEQLIAEMTAHRSPYAAVLFEGDRAIETQEGRQDYEAVFAIYIVVQNHRDGMSRRGEASTPGTNLVRDLLRNALHDQSPNLTAYGWYAQRTEFRGVTVVFQRKDAFVLRAEVAVMEVPVAA